jgi:hypothetical protein
MKTIKYTYLAIITICLLTTISCKAQALQPNVQNEIIGTWIAEDDINVKLVFFTNDTYKSYYEGELSNTYDYSISHQCGIELDNNAWFLKTTNQEDFGQRCYEIYGVNDNSDRVLSIRDMTTGKIFIYNKQ